MLESHHWKNITVIECLLFFIQETEMYVCIQLLKLKSVAPKPRAPTPQQQLTSSTGKTFTARRWASLSSCACLLDISPWKQLYFTTQHFQVYDAVMPNPNPLTHQYNSPPALLQASFPLVQFFTAYRWCIVCCKPNRFVPGQFYIDYALTYVFKNIISWCCMHRYFLCNTQTGVHSIDEYSQVCLVHHFGNLEREYAMNPLLPSQ